MQSECTDDRPTDFKKTVMDWLNIQDRIDNVNGELKGLKKRKQSLEEFIKTFMKNHNKEICNIGDSGEALVLKNKQVKSALKKEDILKVLKETLPEERANDMIKSIYENRSFKESWTLQKKIVN